MVELQGFDEFGRRLASYDQRQQAEIRRTMQAALLVLEADQRRNVAQDTRRLMGSITNEISGTDPIVGRVGPTVRYGLWVEQGRRPGKRPPVQALMGWARRHGVNPYALAWHIARHGTRAQPFVASSLSRNLPTLTRMFGAIGLRLTTFLSGRAV